MSPIKDVIGFINQNSGLVKNWAPKAAENKKALACIAAFGILFAVGFKFRSYIFTASDRTSSNPVSEKDKSPYAGQVKTVAKFEAYIRSSESKWIGMDKTERFSERLETPQGELVIGKDDFYVSIGVVETATERASIYNLPSTLFKNAQDGDVITYRIDGRVVEFSIAQQKYSQTDFQAVLKSNLFALTTFGPTQALSYGSCVDVPEEEKFLLAFESRPTVDFIEFDRENARVYLFGENSFMRSDFKDHYEQMQAKFSFNDGFTYQLNESQWPVRNTEVSKNKVDFDKFEPRDITESDKEFGLAIYTPGCIQSDIAVICSGTKLIVLGFNRGFAPMNISDKRLMYFHGFEKKIEVDALTVSLEHGLLTLGGKFSEDPLT
ncbi:MAG: hypothetical protein HKM07_00965 [Chlamydiae bacterium]|nr:hypothetical protein [Chlamydiota bacterium]